MVYTSRNDQYPGITEKKKKICSGNMKTDFKHSTRNIVYFNEPVSVMEIFSYCFHTVSYYSPMLISQNIKL